MFPCLSTGEERGQYCVHAVAKGKSFLYVPVFCSSQFWIQRRHFRAQEVGGGIASHVGLS